MRSPLAPVNWSEIRRHWEYDPDAPSFAVSAARAASAHGFTAPGRTTVHKRAHSESWERLANKGDMAAITTAAQRKADTLVNRGVDGSETKKERPRDAAMAQLSNEEATDVRAEMLARHRSEWGTVTALIAEAIEGREADPVQAFNRAKLAKITAETIALSQAGERKAWGLDMPDPADFSKMTDAQLEALAAGRNPFGRG